MKSAKFICNVAAAFTVALAAFSVQAVEPTQEVRKYANYYYAYP